MYILNGEKNLSFIWQPVYIKCYQTDRDWLLRFYYENIVQISNKLKFSYASHSSKIKNSLNKITFTWANFSSKILSFSLIVLSIGFGGIVISSSVVRNLLIARANKSNVYRTSIYFFKVYNRGTRTKLLTLIWCLYCKHWTDITHCSGVSIVDFAQFNVGLVNTPQLRFSIDADRAEENLSPA